MSDLRVNEHEALARQPPVHSWQPVDHCAAAAKVNEGQVQADGFLVWARTQPEHFRASVLFVAARPHSARSRSETQHKRNKTQQPNSGERTRGSVEARGKANLFEPTDAEKVRQMHGTHGS